MKKLLPTTLLANLLLSTAAFAEIPQGLSVFGSAGFVDASTTLEGSGDSFSGLGTDDTTFDFGAEYSFGSTNSFAVGAKYLSGYDVFSFESDSDLKLEDDGGYALYLSPRIAIGDSTLLTGTLGMMATDGKVSSPTTTVERDLEGTYFGFGIRHYLNDQTFLEVGVERLDYDSITVDDTTFDGSATKGLITYGITF